MMKKKRIMRWDMAKHTNKKNSRSSSSSPPLSYPCQRKQETKSGSSTWNKSKGFRKILSTHCVPLCQRRRVFFVVVVALSPGEKIQHIRHTCTWALAVLHTHTHARRTCTAVSMCAKPETDRSFFGGGCCCCCVDVRNKNQQNESTGHTKAERTEFDNPLCALESDDGKVIPCVGKGAKTKKKKKMREKGDGEGGAERERKIHEGKIVHISILYPVIFGSENFRVCVFFYSSSFNSHCTRVRSTRIRTQNVFRKRLSSPSTWKCEKNRFSFSSAHEAAAFTFGKNLFTRIYFAGSFLSCSISVLLHCIHRRLAHARSVKWCRHHQVRGNWGYYWHGLTIHTHTHIRKI